MGRTFLAPLFSYLLHLSASCYNIRKNSSVLCVLQRLEGRRQLASVAGPELCPSFICSAWLSHPQLCGLFVIIFIASSFAILIINLPFNPRMNSITTACSFTKGHFPLLPTESWLLPWFDDFGYTEDNSGSLPARGMSLLVLSGYEQPLTVFPLMGDGRVLKKNTALGDSLDDHHLSC